MFIGGSGIKEYVCSWMASVKHVGARYIIESLLKTQIYKSGLGSDSMSKKPEGKVTRSIFVIWINEGVIWIPHEVPLKPG